MATQSGFLSFIRSTMGISIAQLPDASGYITQSYGLAIDTVNLAIAGASSNYYDLAVYNLAGDFLINSAQDQTGQTVFTQARQTYHINDFVAGVISAASDNSTAETISVPEQFQALTISDLQNLKTPYGRMYLSIAQKYGSLWGVS